MKRLRAGFTLVEMLILMAVLAIIMALSAPTYLRYIQTLRMREGAQQVARDLERARSEAKRTNTCWSFQRRSTTEYRLQSYVIAATSTTPQQTSRDCQGAAGQVIDRTMARGSKLNLVSTADTAFFRPPFGTNYGAVEKVSFTVSSSANNAISSTVSVLGIMGKVIVK